MAAVDYFLKLDDIKGESGDDKHKGEIELESWSWGAAQAGTGAVGMGSGAGKVLKEDLKITKRLDKSSPNLMIACATGKHFKQAVLTVRKAGGGQQEYLKLTMDQVLVSKYDTEGSSMTDTVPTETVHLNFAVLEMSYKPQKPDGTLDAEVKQKYDFGKNVKV